VPDRPIFERALQGAIRFFDKLLTEAK
jgi:hypothetical protein